MTPDELELAILDGILLRPCEAAAALRVDRDTVARLAATGRLASIRTPGRRHRYDPASVLAYLNQTERSQCSN